MRLFEKSNTEELDNVRKINDIAQAEDHETDKHKAYQNSGNAKIDGIQLEIESLKAQITSLKEIINRNNEKFSHINEEISEIRTIEIEHKKETHEIEIKTEKAVGLIAEMHPESILPEIKKQDAKLEAMKTKSERQDLLSNKIIDELKDIKIKISTFRSIDYILKLNKELHDEITSIKKIVSIVGIHNERVESIYTSFEKNIKSFEKTKEELKDVKELSERLSKNIEKNTAALGTVPKRDEFNSIKKDIEKNLKLLKSEKSVSDKHNTELEDKLNNVINQTKNIIEDAIPNITKDIENRNSKIKDMVFKKDLEGILSAQERNHIDNQEMMTRISPLKKSMDDLEKKHSTSVSDLKKIDVIQNEIMKELRKSQDDIIQNLDSKITGKTEVFEKRLRELSSIISIMEKNRSKKDLDASYFKKMKADIQNTLDEKIAGYIKEVEKKSSVISESISTLAKNDDMQLKRIDEMNASKDNDLAKTKKETLEMIEKKVDELKNNYTHEDENIKKEFTVNIENLNKNITDISQSISNYKNNVKHMTDTTKALISTTALKGASEPKIGVGITTTPQAPYNNTINTEPQVNTNQHTIIPITTPSSYDYDLRAGKLIRLIKETEKLLKNNNMTDAKKTYKELVLAYTKVYMKLPRTQVDTIYPQIKSIYYKLKTGTPKD